MKVLHVECGRHWCGGPVQVFYLMRGLRERGHENVLLCPKGIALAQKARSLGLRVQEVPFSGDLDLRFALAVRRVVRTEAPEVVHLHSRRGADTLGSLGARWGKAPAVVISRRVDDPVRPTWWNRWRFGPLCDHIIAISEGIRRVLLEAGLPPGKITCVRSALDPTPFDLADQRTAFRREWGWPEESLVVGLIAQLIERKGHRYLLEAIPAVLARCPNAFFFFCGQGPLEDRLKHQVQLLGLEGHVRFAGFRSDVPRLLAGLDVVVHPALREGLGIALLEAMAARRPVVATQVGGIPEAVRHGENGLLVPPADREALAEALITLLCDAKLRERLGQRGREIVEQEFSVDRMVEGNLQVYEHLGNRQGQGGRI